MPSPTTIDEFLDLVRKSGVVDEKRLATHLERLRAAGALPAEPVGLATQLVRDGVLTRFQAEQFLRGRWRRFTIGKYKILEPLGSGGMGSVYLCEHMLMHRRVAVKVLPAAKAGDNSSLERFYREARAVAALDHPNIVRAYDIDKDENPPPLHFLVLEHVDGSSLQEVVKRTGPMDAVRACHYIRQAALGLQHAHETAGLVHRDIKPGNIVVDRNGIVKVLDMGLARFFHDQEDVLTKKYDENVLGTADYLAPEQARDSHNVDIRADLYSLGATFYFCLTGRTPFAEGTVAQKLLWHQTRQPKPIRSLRPEVPEGVAAVVEKMMAKDPSQRYPDPLAVADALAPWTQTPIPPPPDNEMPQFSPAAGVSAGASTMATTAGSTAELSPAPRKVWQVPPSPLASQAAVSAPPPAPAAPAPRQATALADKAANGNGRSAPVGEAEEAEWPGAGEAPLPALDRGPSRRRTTPSPGKRGAPDLARPDSGTALVLWLVLGGLALLVALPAASFLAYWLLFSSPTPKEEEPRQVREPLRVNPAIGQRLANAVRQAHPGDTIYLQGDIAEYDISVTTADLTIAPEPGKRIVWKVPQSTPTQAKLLSVTASNFRLKGLTLDGNNRAEALVQLYGSCPGTRLEDLELRGIRKYGVLSANCEGKRDEPIQLLNLRFHTPKDATALYFIFDHTPSIPRNRFFTVRTCTFDGPGHKVRLHQSTDIDPATVELPPGIKPSKEDKRKRR